MGPKQHTVPAVYLAGFAEMPRSRARESLLWVGRRGVGTPFQTKAERISVVENLYTLKRPIGWSNRAWSPHDLDAMWHPVESQLSWAIETLIGSGGCIDAKMWLFVLVAFAAQTFVRGLDFGDRFVARIPEELRRTFAVADSDHINGARLIELHRLRGAVRHANWTILHARAGRFITNDLARTPILYPNGRMGYVMPLRGDAALALTFRVKDHQPMSLHTHSEDRWVVGPIGHETLEENRVAALNDMLASSAVKEIYGAPQHLVGNLHARMSRESPPRNIVEPTILGPSRDMGDSREFERLALLVATPPSQCEGSEGERPCLCGVTPETGSAHPVSGTFHG